ncbi:ABC transporter [Chromatiales bacterium (ex Bugula neritina AB1)]|nr:ABC transporter [Chromatiales bacterium (ex Bugula neritina AB1)]
MACVERSPDSARLSATDIHFRRGQREILNGVSITVEPGQLIGLIGPNGAGKSTLLSIMAGLQKADRGEVSLAGKPLSAIDARVRAQRLGWLEQMATVHWPVSAEHLVTLGRLPYLSSWQSLSEQDRRVVDAALAATDCEGFRQQSVTTLSGGELTRVMLARALASQPQVLLADEPVAALDIGHQLQTMDYLRKFADKHHACVAVLHDLTLAARYCDRLFLLDHGKLIASGTVDSVLSVENIRQVYGVDILTGGADVPWIIPVQRVER